MTKPLGTPLNLALALLTSALLILTFPKFDIAWLAPIAVTPLLIAAAREPRPLYRFLLGEAAGIAYWFGVCTWIQYTLEVYGGMGHWGSWGTFLLFCVLKAIHMGLFAMLAGVLFHNWYAVPVISALWVGIERTHGTFGFAWLALGNAGIDLELPMRLAPYVGVYGLSFLYMLLATSAAVVIVRRSRRELAWLIVVPALFFLPERPAPEAPEQKAIAVQPALSEDQEWTPVAAAQMQEHLLSLSLENTLGSNARLIVWPEAPGPIYYYRDRSFRTQADNLARSTHAYFLFGTVAWTPQGAPLNSAVMLGPDGSVIDRYDKINLVPFGEYVPKIFSFVNRITQEAGDFAPGKRVVVFPVDQGHKIGVFICYESVFPNEVRQFVKRGAQLLVNISNDGYFGHSAAREQHLKIARMRAAENKRWLLRVTNDGITVSIDPGGRIIQRLPMYLEEVGRLGFNYIDATTPYTRYGDWFAWGCLLAAAVALCATQIPHYTPMSKRSSRGESLTRRRL